LLSGLIVVDGLENLPKSHTTISPSPSHHTRRTAVHLSCLADQANTHLRRGIDAAGMRALEVLDALEGLAHGLAQPLPVPAMLFVVHLAHLLALRTGWVSTDRGMYVKGLPRRQLYEQTTGVGDGLTLTRSEWVLAYALARPLVSKRVRGACAAVAEDLDCSLRSDWEPRSGAVLGLRGTHACCASSLGASTGG
jgi:hypothetical protein